MTVTELGVSWPMCLDLSPVMTVCPILFPMSVTSLFQPSLPPGMYQQVRRRRSDVEWMVVAQEQWPPLSNGGIVVRQVNLGNDDICLDAP